MLLETASPAVLDARFSQFSVEFATEEIMRAGVESHGVVVPESMHKAVDKRKAEFVAGRHCATQAIRTILPGFDRQIEISAEHRRPIWPEGIVGSITHTAGFASAAVARASAIRGVGLDTETIMSGELVQEVGRYVRSSDEAPPASAGLDDAVFTTLVFSAKESVFKCLHPLANKMFSFSEAKIEIVDYAKCQFQATLLVDLDDELRMGTKLEGNYRIERNRLHTAVIRER